MKMVCTCIFDIPLLDFSVYGLLKKEVFTIWNVKLKQQLDSWEHQQIGAGPLHQEQTERSKWSDYCIRNKTQTILFRTLNIEGIVLI